MALAETASIFCETILTDRALDEATDPGVRLALLEADLQGACQVVVDIRSRFLFEPSVFAARRQQALSPRRLCELMRRRPARRLRRRPRPRRAPPLHVGGQAALLPLDVLQLALHVRAALRPRPLRPLAGRRRPASAPPTTSCCRRPAWARPRSWRPASASTSRTRRSGRSSLDVLRAPHRRLLRGRRGLSRASRSPARWSAPSSRRCRS